MNIWSNIPIPPQDPEIIKINEFEAGLGELPESVHKIRELITRLEVCHFKYRQHIEKIRDSIMNLEPVVRPERIGEYHIQHGESAWENDPTGKSLLGQQYIWAIKSWLDETPPPDVPDRSDKELEQKVCKWLGGKSAHKIRLVRLLLARMTWDWKPYEEMQHGGEYGELEFQICRMDICHYAFPTNLDRVLEGIGKMRPTENFEGCGCANNNIKENVAKELFQLNDLFSSFIKDKSDNKSQIKAWLFASLIKTLKEQAELSETIHVVF